MDEIKRDGYKSKRRLIRRRIDKKPPKGWTS